MYSRIIFVDGDEGRRIVDALTHTDGAVVQGVTAASIEAVTDHLAQWDNGEHHHVDDTSGAGLTDSSAQVDAYTLTWNTGLGYVALAVMVDDDVLDPQVMDVYTCRGCGQPVDYCLDHTHAPDPESAEWRADYDGVSARITKEVYA